ncbi:SDR family NAD(P)-dependent oxidoreductase [Pelagibius litoralis]|uniref:SDR family NAD(P)-dependent oxidoreductase n=1 Tax=Pelagibius litoralis TaxID=374515 RepID=A0A967EZK0_9PROT|nr:SDR family NAD(P)-dependent oxidoreductase [Pelagibius litoralis]NIA70300.1 SDR family NAD(P)-dependent oxidoreductase [Pelagibius litoralis]
MQDPKSIVITGGSSGIGAALALRYAGPDRFLALSGRDRQRLDDVAAQCRAAGAEVDTRVLDVCDRDALEAWLGEVDDHHPLDLVIANAGVSAGTGAFGEDALQTRHILSVNVDGVVSTVLAAVALMRPRGRGQVAIVSSLAAFRGFPGAPAYCASKAAVRVWGEALRGMVAGDGLSVSVICPGYVKSRMTAVNEFPMPFLMEAERAAAIIERGLAAGKARIVFPRRLFAVVWLLALLPPAWTDPLLRRLPEKSATPK